MLPTNVARSLWVGFVFGLLAAGSSAQDDAVRLAIAVTHAFHQGDVTALQRHTHPDLLDGIRTVMIARLHTPQSFAPPPHLSPEAVASLDDNAVLDAFMQHVHQLESAHSESSEEKPRWRIWGEVKQSPDRTRISITADRSNEANDAIPPINTVVLKRDAAGRWKFFSDNHTQTYVNPVLAGLHDTADELLTEALLLYPIETQTGIVARKEFTNTKGQISKTVYYRARPRAYLPNVPYEHKPPRGEADIIPAAIHLHRFDQNGRKLWEGILDADLVLQRALESFHPPEGNRIVRHWRDADGIVRYRMIFENGRTISHIYFDESGKRIVRIRGQVPPGTDTTGVEVIP